MNIVIIIVFLIIACTINAEVRVVSVRMTFLASSHAKELTRVINAVEDEGCLLFDSGNYNDATYLYFRCPKKE
jgi:hypothetical protein